MFLLALIPSLLAAPSAHYKRQSVNLSGWARVKLNVPLDDPNNLISINPSTKEAYLIQCTVNAATSCACQVAYRDPFGNLNANTACSGYEAALNGATCDVYVAPIANNNPLYPYCVASPYTPNPPLPPTETTTTTTASASATAAPTPLTTPGLIKWSNDGTIGNKCLSVSDGKARGGANGTPLQLWDCNSADPNFIFQKIGNNIQWINDGSIQNKCIAVQNGINLGSTDGIVLSLYDCSKDDPNQQFSIEGNNIKWIGNGNSKCVAMKDGKSQLGVNGVPAVVWTCFPNDANFLFSF